jgi:hypothetical protein
MVMLCGCIQSPPAVPATPVQTAGVVVILPDTTATQHPRMMVNISAEKMTDSVVISVDGGPDAGALASLVVRINNYDGTSVQRTLPSPEIGRQYRIQYFRTANAANVNIIGTFSDGYQQTLLMTSV